ncbi:glycosyltransferase [Marivirga sp.]|uniref:glycosyltransferase n=1 Tax=Marivirga sp. TaxID=2018662 RepID=UPI003DA6DE2E
MELVSIIIVNYNSFDYTYKCIKSIIDKTKDISYEVIVVDNASTDFNKRKLEDLSPSVKVIENIENLGFAKANNIGIQYSNSDVILLLNNDTLLLNDAISKCYNKLKEDKSIGTIGCKLFNEDLTWQKSFYEFPTLKSQFRKLFRIKGRPVYDDSSNYVHWLTGAFLMFRKSSLQLFEEKKLKEDFFMYCEDIQWGMQFKKVGLNNFYYPKGQIVHYQGKSSTFQDDFSKKQKYYYPNLFILIWKEFNLVYAYTYFLLEIIVRISTFKLKYWYTILPLSKVMLKHHKK